MHCDNPLQRLGNAIDAVRTSEAKLQKAQRKRPERLTEEQKPNLAEPLKHNLRTGRAYLLKEDFRLLRDLRSPRRPSGFDQALVPARDALAHQADVEGSQDGAQAPGTDLETVPLWAGLLLRRGRGPEHQGESGPQESERIPTVRVLLTCPASYACGFAATRTRASVLLKSQD